MLLSELCIFANHSVAVTNGLRDNHSYFILKPVPATHSTQLIGYDRSDPSVIDYSCIVIQRSHTYFNKSEKN